MATKVPLYQATYTLQKQILIGTPEKVSRLHQVIIRRQAKIRSILKQATDYYLWQVQRLKGKQTSMGYYIKEAAAELGVSNRTIKRWNKIVKGKGFVKIEKRSHEDWNSYARYHLQEINEIIQDWGMTESRGGDTDGTVTVTRTSPLTVNPKERLQQAPPSLHGSSHAPRAERRSLAEPAVAVSKPLQGESSTADGEDETGIPDHVKHDILSWCRTNHKFFHEHGFREKTAGALYKDIITWVSQHDNPEGLWKAFIDVFWERLQIKITHKSWWLHKTRSNKNLGAGWIFKCTDKHESDSNLQIILLSSRYSKAEVTWPKELSFPWLKEPEPVKPVIRVIDEISQDRYRWPPEEIPTSLVKLAPKARFVSIAPVSGTGYQEECDPELEKLIGAIGS